MHQQHQNNLARLNIWLPLLFAIVLVAGMMIGMRLQSETPSAMKDVQGNHSADYATYGKIEELLRYIEAKYVDNINRDKLIDEAINSILKQLDPHSTYISSDQLKAVNEQLEGNFEGVGIEFMILDDTVVVVAPLAGGPAESAGVLAGDKIVAVEDSTIAGNGITSSRVMDLLRGEKGSKVKIGVLRGSELKVRRFTITRDEIPMNSVDVAYMINSQTGYIKINRFSATTYEEFMKSLEKLVEKQGMKDLVIDLRQNPGGYLQQATNILSQLFRDKDKLLVYTEGRSVSRSDYESSGKAFFEVQNIVVLIDEGSASASEILAGALQDHDRAYIVGRRSFGKGLVQEQYNLRDGSALRLTVARYYTPSGRSIQKPYSDLEKYEADMMERYHSGELSSENRVAIADTTKYYTTAGRVVFGGGGITPDVFVPIDTVLFNEYYIGLRQQVPEFAYRYLQEHRTQFEYSSIERFKNQYHVSEALINELLQYAAKNGVAKDLTQLAVVEKDIKLFIKAQFARLLFDEEGYFSVINDDDPEVQRALEILKHPMPFTAYQKKK